MEHVYANCRETTMNNQPLLTIAIPTYNRASYLDLCLKRIAEEIADLSTDHRCLVNVYVSDNASLDNTVEITSKYQSLNLYGLKVVRNTENIGADKNIAQCYDSAMSPYVWILGDDDIILPGCLVTILDALQNQDIDILYLTNYWFTANYTERVLPQKTHGVSKFGEPLEFARRTNVMLTFISALVVRSSIGLGLRSELLVSNLVQFSWVLPLLRDGKCFAIIEDWVVAAKGSNSGGYGLIKVFGSNLVRITNQILKDKPAIARAIQNGAIVNFFAGFILDYRKGNSQFSDKDMGVGLKDVYGDNWRYYVFLAPLIRLPMFVANYYHVFLKVIRRLFRSVLL